MLLPIHDSCPICGRPVTSVTIERDPDCGALAIRHYNCSRCGPVEMAALSLADPVRLKRKAS